MAYDQWQQTYCISNTVNALFSYQTVSKTTQAGQSADLSKVLADLADTAFANPDNVGLIGSWTRVWGPVVWQSDNSRTADNSMMVAANEDRSRYVVAIAGTGLHSDYDQKVEDVEVVHVTWPSFDINIEKGKPFIARGTSIGVNVLLGMTDPDTGADLRTFLASVASTSATLVFTGHSLGGALVQPFSLYLFTEGANPLDKLDWDAVYVYPTAAPTPGNSLFNGLFSDTFPPTTPSPQEHDWCVWNEIIWNQIDVVPHAWTLQGDSADGTLPYLQEIKTIFGNKSIAEVDGAVDSAVAAATTAGGGLIFNSANASFPSTPSQTPTDFKTFFDEVLYQHLKVYGMVLGTTDFAVPAAPLIDGAGPNPAAIRLPVLGSPRG